jgi:hypothetical protein
MGLSVEGIRDLAERPEPFELPAPAVRSEQAEADWRAAVEAAAKQTEVKAERRGALETGAPRLNRATLLCISEGPPEPNRHTALYSAAANLAEFGCSEALALALLSESALDGGLPPSEVPRTILSGLKRAPMTPPPAPVHTAPVTAAGPDTHTAELAALWARSEEPAPPCANPAHVEPGEASEPPVDLPRGPAPNLPAGAKLYFADAKSRSCPATEAFKWTWEGAPQWFVVAQYPIPTGTLRREGP